MNFTHIARTLRPKKFADIVGQTTSVRLIQQALIRNLMLPVCSIYGPSGVGKTTFARLIAMWQCCTDRQNNEPCGICTNCSMILNDTHPDVFELDGGTYTGVENIKSLLDTCNYSTCVENLNNKKVYILDEVHMLSKHAMTALLKRLEEPLNNLQFILATTNVEKLPDTILSRSFKIRLDPVPQVVINQYLQKVCEVIGSKADTESLSYISYAANGSMRQALSFLEQISIIANSNISADITQEVLGIASHNIIGSFIDLFDSSDIDKMFVLLQNIKHVEPMLFLKQILSKIQDKIWDKTASTKLIRIGYDLAEASIVMHKSPYSNNILEICIGYALANNS